MNKRTLAVAAGIALATLDARIASDQAFPVVRRGAGKGDEWQFDLDQALSRLEELSPPAAQSPSQEFMALRVVEKRRAMALEASDLFRKSELLPVLQRASVALRNSLLAMPGTIAAEMGLTREQERTMRTIIERLLREYVEKMQAQGLAGRGNAE